MAERFFEKKERVKKKITNGCYLLKDGYIKMYCVGCDKKFDVPLWAAINEIAKYGSCKCSSCGNMTLNPYE